MGTEDEASKSNSVTSAYLARLEKNNARSFSTTQKVGQLQQDQLDPFQGTKKLDPKINKTRKIWEKPEKPQTNDAVSTVSSLEEGSSLEPQTNEPLGEDVQVDQALIVKQQKAAELLEQQQKAQSDLSKLAEKAKLAAEQQQKADQERIQQQRNELAKILTQVRRNSYNNPDVARARAKLEQLKKEAAKNKEKSEAEAKKKLVDDQNANKEQQQIENEKRVEKATRQGIKYKKSQDQSKGKEESKHSSHRRNIPTAREYKPLSILELRKEAPRMAKETVAPNFTKFLELYRESSLAKGNMRAGRFDLKVYPAKEKREQDDRFYFTVRAESIDKHLRKAIMELRDSSDNAFQIETDNSKKTPPHMKLSVSSNISEQDLKDIMNKVLRECRDSSKSPRGR